MASCIDVHKDQSVISGLQEGKGCMCQPVKDTGEVFLMFHLDSGGNLRCSGKRVEQFLIACMREKFSSCIHLGTFGFLGVSSSPASTLNSVGLCM